MRDGLLFYTYVKGDILYDMQLGINNVAVQLA